MERKPEFLAFDGKRLIGKEFDEIVIDPLWSFKGDSSIFLLLACSVLVFAMGLITLIVSPRDIVPYVSTRRNWDDRGWDNGQRGWDDRQLGYECGQIRWNDDDYVAKDDAAFEVITFIVFVLALLAIHVWTYMIVYRCYQLFVAKRKTARLLTHQVPSFPNPLYEKVPETKPILKDVVP
uniref:Uncharacterized protein n=1 Tax=Panagrolaimus davidi TaxID=227884 RepID=A0A914QU83_9BILA